MRNANGAIILLCSHFFVFACLASGEDLDFHDGRVSAVQIDDFLSKRKGKRSPLIGEGKSFVDNGRTFGIDPALIAAISGIETAFGTLDCSTNNAWNWFWNGPCPKSPFNSFDSGITTVSKYLRRNYLNKGYISIPLIQTKYCTAPVSKNGIVCPGWITTVTLFRRQILGTAPDVPVPVAPLAPESDQTPTRSSYTVWLVLTIAVLFALAGGWLLGRSRRLSRMIKK
jgi:hypothetical protein